MNKRKARKFTHDSYHVKTEMLGRYNAEVNRGISHTKEWDEKMAELQKWFNGYHKDLGNI